MSLFSTEKPSAEAPEESPRHTCSHRPLRREPSASESRSAGPSRGHISSHVSGDVSERLSSDENELSRSYPNRRYARSSDRLAALRRYDILDTPPEEHFDRLTDLAADIFDAPIALLSFVDADRQWFKSCLGISVEETGLDVSFCVVAIETEDVTVVHNAVEDERFADNPLVAGPPHIRFYAGAPIETPDGHRLGTLCVIDTTPRSDVPQHRLDHLAYLADTVAHELELRREIERRRERESVLKRAYEREERARRMAEEARRVKSTFLAHMSHEIRTPLTSIVGFAELLEEVVDEEAERFAQLIQKSAHSLKETLTAVLTLSKLEVGEMELSARPVNLRRHVQEQVRPFAAEAEEKGLDLSVSVNGEDGSLRACADGAGVDIVLRNLISNSLKYTPAGGSVRIETLGPVERGDRTEVGMRVSDTGIGMDPDVIPQLFEPFRQASEGLDRTYEGVGLGLTIVQHTVDAMNGRLDIDTTPGEGTAVNVWLPAAT